MKKRTLFFVIAAVLLVCTTITVFAAANNYTMTYHPGTTDLVTNLPSPDSGLGGSPYAVSSQIPQREGYEFLGWTLDYGLLYKVTYKVNPDPVYGIPEDSRVPTDPNEYSSGALVTVADQLTNTQDFGINAKTGEKRPGRWEFIPWDKTDFRIYEDTTITGEWKFISKFKYTVHHLDIDDFRQLADDEVYWLVELGQVEPKSKKPATEFYTAYQKSKYNPVTEKVYRNKREDFLLPGATYVKNKTQFIMTVTLTEDDQHIFFFYQRPSAG